LPPTVGWLASGIMLRDPFQEAVLTTPYSQARLTVRLFIWQLAGQPQINLLKLGLAGLPVMLLFGATGLWRGGFSEKTKLTLWRRFTVSTHMSQHRTE